MRPRCLLAVLGLFVLAGQLQLFAAEKTQVRLVLSAQSARAGDTITAGVELKMSPRWHTYWRFPGESGIATKIEWTLPPGITAGEIQWPVPEKLISEGFTTFVYHDKAMLLVPLKIASDAAAGPQIIKANVSWLECSDVCLPGKGSVQANVLIGTETKLSTENEQIESARKKLPVIDDSLKASARWDKGNDARPLLIEWKASKPLVDADFYPYGDEKYEMAGTVEAKTEGSKVTIRKEVKKTGDQWPSEILGLIVLEPGSAENRQAYEVTLRPGGSSPTAAAVAPQQALATVTPPASTSASAAAAVPSLLKVLWLAFLGGFILNFMPCVLPVIALKILGFVNQSRESVQRVRLMGWLYALGVFVSFLVLAGLVIVVQKAGKQASWGMQFQNPQFLVVMTVLVVLVSLNLFGLFEITLTGRAMGAAGTLASKEGAAGAFFNGMLATALATPCTAPALAVALGYAFTQGPGTIVLLFTAVAAGLAFPYVLLSYFPDWLKFLPKPGAWMEKFKIAMGFPLLATAIWLFWLATTHFDAGGTLWLGLFLVIVSMTAWIWGEFVQRGRSRKGLAIAICVLGLIGGYCFVLEGKLDWRSPPTVAAGSSKIHGGDGIDWRPWSLEAVEQARALGHPVVVDFTADWCLICQVNKKTSIAIPKVRQKLEEINAVALLGDHTREDPAITSELKKYQRAGVPLVLVFPADRNAPPIILPEVLTPGIVLDALEKAAGKRVASR